MKRNIMDTSALTIVFASTASVLSGTFCNAAIHLIPGFAHASHWLASNLAVIGLAFPVVRNGAVQRIYERARKLSKSDLPMLITGETGSGKEILARYVHENSQRSSSGGFVAINCAAIPDNLLESELFGYVKGAFTDARSDKTGLFAIADGGTLFLDEVAEMSLSVQKKLLRALEYQEFYPVGSVAPKKVKFRLVCATSENLDQMVKTKAFRVDLYHRIHACELTIPPLRERIDEISALVNHFLGINGRGDIVVSPEVMEIFSCYGWPGNIRELRNVVEYALAVLDEKENLIEVGHLPEGKFDTLNCRMLRGESLNLREKERCFKENLVEAAMTVCSGDYKSVAKSLGTSKSTVYELVAGKLSKQNVSATVEE
ncbi:MAG: sigma-54 dependent transcriptional regulator [Bacteroidetes bacterium]|nr:sigma-54 dependent transcriptional regulator [Bacteroidota bacterium]